MKIAHGTLVMAVDGERLLLLRNEGDEKFPVLETVSHVSRHGEQTHHLGTDRPGRTSAGSVGRRSSLDETDWHDREEDAFAVQAAELLEQATSRFDAAIMVLAPPRTLGVLRKHWGPVTRKRIVAEIDKDFAHREADDVAAAILATDA